MGGRCFILSLVGSYEGFYVVREYYWIECFLRFLIVVWRRDKRVVGLSGRLFGVS